MIEFSKTTKEDFLRAIYFACGCRAENLGLKHGAMAVGLLPASKGACRWLRADPDDGIVLAMTGIKKGEDITEYAARAQDIAAKMAKHIDWVHRQQEACEDRRDVEYAKQENGETMVCFEIIEHDYSYCENGGRVALTVVVYVSGVTEKELKVAWAPEQAIMEWATENNDMWTQSHTPESLDY